MIVGPNVRYEFFFLLILWDLIRFLLTDQQPLNLHRNSITGPPPTTEKIVKYYFPWMSSQRNNKEIFLPLWLNYCQHLVVDQKQCSPSQVVWVLLVILLRAPELIYHVAHTQLFFPGSWQRDTVCPTSSRKGPLEKGWSVWWGTIGWFLGLFWLEW